ncbi:MAG: Uma2 family endonuclease [Cyanobacteria bacterium J06638_20]
MTVSTAKNSDRSEIKLREWYPATWNEYATLRDEVAVERARLFFNEGWLWVDMGAEGINHASISDLITMLFYIWATQQPEQVFTSLGRCLLEKPSVKAGAPDLVLYLGDNYPRWQPCELRRINLDQWSAPNLVGEISDTTLATDLDEKKQIYAALGIPEYWVVDVQGQRIFIFQLQDGQRYQECDESKVLAGLSAGLLTQALQKLAEVSNIQVATWLSQQLLT